ncbi:MAG TPA: 16S rRNA (uracil(1498)-N(3))-methyltransferase [Pyrinomonadaceae bacterium]|nr:16S rRNA (uracil(1498)-N(3))-methyltransferase [Pyrinomonadaceae bacterium]
MSRRRFYAPVEAFSADYVTLAAAEARHLRDVLRLGPGDEICVFDGEGREFQCVIEESRRDWANLRLIEEVSAARPESPLDLTLAIALLKGEKFDLVVQKATELGVTRIQPVVTQRGDVRLRDEQDAKRVTRWQRIALEAAKQSGRARVPEVAAPVSFSSLVEGRSSPVSTAAENDAHLLMFSERDGQPLAEVFKPLGAISLPFTALVGSEGGWTDEEIAHARAAGWGIVTLGGRVLRAETAAITVVVLLQHRLGDLT